MPLFAVAATAFVFYMLATRFGLSMRSVHDDENVAALFGVNVRMTQVMTFTLGGVMAGLAGALYAHQYNYIEIQYFNILISIFVLLYVLIGGTQTAFGPLFGAALFTFLLSFVAGAVPGIGAMVSLTLLWSLSGNGLADGPLIMQPVLPLLTGVAVLLDVTTAALIAHLVARDEAGPGVPPARLFA